MARLDQRLKQLAHKQQMQKPTIQRSMDLPEVKAVPGMPDGFLMGSTAFADDGDRVWDVIVHPDLKEYTVRQQGCDETTGFLVRLPEAFVAEVAMKSGVEFDPKNPPQELAQVQGAMIIVRAGEKGYALTLQLLVQAASDRVEESEKDQQ